MQPAMTAQITEFRRWREAMGMTQAQAASALGVSASQVKNWDAGTDRGAGVPAVPSLATRVFMAVLAQGIEVKPWPDVAAAKAKRRAKG
jgi:DNA-binding transcriptional regulator YiaG